MINITSSADLAQTLDAPLDMALRQLLILRCGQLIDGMTTDLAEIAQFVIVQAGDTLEAVEAAAGLPLATNLVDGSRLGEAEFTPSFEFVERHPGWIEAALILSDDGFATVLFIPDRDDIDDRLLALVA